MVSNSRLDAISMHAAVPAEQANDLLACIDLELEKARQAGNGDDNSAVCVTVIREAEDSEANAETDAETDAETVPTGTLGRGIFNLPSPTREESGESTNGASDATTAEVSAVGGREGRLADVEACRWSSRWCRHVTASAPEPGNRRTKGAVVVVVVVVVVVAAAALNSSSRETLLWRRIRVLYRR